jgi:hypothetical protein
MFYIKNSSQMQAKKPVLWREATFKQESLAN